MISVICPKCGKVGKLYYNENIKFYVKHGAKVTHYVKGDQVIEIVPNEKRVSLIWYMGGDYFLLPIIYKLFAPHTCYVEAFGGGASVLLNKSPSKVEVYNDIDGLLVNLFKVVKEKYDEFMKRIEFILYSRQLYYEYLEKLRRGEGDDVDKAVMYFYVMRASFAGKFGAGFGYSITINQPKKLFNAIENLKIIHRRLKNVMIEQLDFRECIKRYDSKNTFFYLDPPHLYVASERENYYRTMFTEADYMDLLNILTGIKGKFLLKQTRAIFFVEDWARRNGFKVRTFRAMLSSKKVKGVERNEWMVQFIANYNI